MAKSVKNWSPGEENLTGVLLDLHHKLSNAGAAEARLVDDLIVEILDPEGDINDYIGSLEELIGWAKFAQNRLLKLQKTGR
jgi:hypothetical protein